MHNFTVGLIHLIMKLWSLSKRPCWPTTRYDFAYTTRIEYKYVFVYCLLEIGRSSCLAGDLQRKNTLIPPTSKYFHTDPDTERTVQA